MKQLILTALIFTMVICGGLSLAADDPFGFDLAVAEETDTGTDTGATVDDDVLTPFADSSINIDIEGDGNVITIIDSGDGDDSINTDPGDTEDEEDPVSEEELDEPVLAPDWNIAYGAAAPGWATAVVLINATDVSETAVLDIFSDDYSVSYTVVLGGKRIKAYTLSELVGDHEGNFGLYLNSATIVLRVTPFFNPEYF